MEFIDSDNKTSNYQSMKLSFRYYKNLRIDEIIP